jgi:hypothetical protein
MSWYTCDARFEVVVMLNLKNTAFRSVIPFTLADTYLLTYGAEPFLRSCQLCSHSGTSQHFKEPEGSSPCSQDPSTGPYPELDRSSPYHPILSLYDPF